MYYRSCFRRNISTWPILRDEKVIKGIQDYSVKYSYLKWIQRKRPFQP